MKNNYLLFSILLFIIPWNHILAQPPEAIKYQMVVRDNSDNLLTNQNISLRLTILKGGVQGSTVYCETHAISTNQFGLVNLNIGTGTVVGNGNFSLIDWGSDSFFLKTEIDLTGGTSYTLTGTSQFLSVPYSLNSKNAARLNGHDTSYFVNTITNQSISGNKTFMDPVSIENKININSLFLSCEVHNLDTEQQPISYSFVNPVVLLSSSDPDDDDPIEVNFTLEIGQIVQIKSSRLGNTILIPEDESFYGFKHDTNLGNLVGEFDNYTMDQEHRWVVIHRTMDHYYLLARGGIGTEYIVP